MPNIPYVTTDLGKQSWFKQAILRNRPRTYPYWISRADSPNRHERRRQAAILRRR